MKRVPEETRRAVSPWLSSHGTRLVPSEGEGEGR